MDRLRSLTDKGMLIELVYLLNQYESERIAIYGSLAAANNIYMEADFTNFLFSISAILPIDTIAAQTPIFPEWNKSILYPFYSILEFDNLSITGGAFEFEMIRPTSGAFVSKLFITDFTNVIQTIYDEVDGNNGEVIPSGKVISSGLDINFQRYYLALGFKNNPLGNGVIFSNQNSFLFTGFVNGWYEFLIEDGGDSNFSDWAFKVRGLPPIYQPLLVPQAIILTMQKLNARADFANDPSQLLDLQIDLPNLKVNIEAALRFTENYATPLRVLC